MRFTCQNGHNFFLSLEKLQKTYDMLTKSSSLTEIDVESLCWCNKCSKFYYKLKQYAARLKLQVLGGLYEKRILMQCKHGDHKFTVSYTKKLE